MQGPANNSKHADDLNVLARERDFDALEAAWMRRLDPEPRDLDDLFRVAGYLVRRAGLVFPPVYFPYYFVVIHMAGLVGLWALLRRSDRPYWEPRQ